MPYNLVVGITRRWIGPVLLFLGSSFSAFAQAPVITAQPVAQTVLDGQFAAFVVGATGTPLPSYQWKKDGIPLESTPGTPPFGFVIASATAADAGAYSVTVTNSLGSVTSTPVPLAVGAVQMNPLGVPSTSLWSVSSTQSVATRITVTSPTKLVAAIGHFSHGSGTLFVAVVPLSSLTAVPVGTAAAETPFNAGEVIASSTFTLPSGFSGRVTVPLSADLTPGVYGVVFGSGYLGATGSGGMLRYSSTTGSNGFYRNGPPGGTISWLNSTSSNWTIGLATVVGSGPAPAIVVPPAAAAVALGGKTTLTVVAAGTGPLSYQWFKDGSIFSGAGSTTSTLLLSNVLAATAGNYTVTVSNAVGTVTSDPAALAISSTPSPSISIFAPSAGINLQPGSTQIIGTVASPETGRTITNVSFYANGVSLGAPVTVVPHNFNWTPTVPGTYALTARAGDSAGVTTTSAPVAVTVSLAGPPAVAISSPAAGASVSVGVPVVVTANVTPAAGRTLTSVAYVASGVGFGSSAGAPPHSSIWTPTTTGAYTLTVEATDDLGIRGASAPITVTVVAPLGPAVVATAGGAQHSLLLRADGVLLAVGDNSFGQLGDGTRTGRLLPFSPASGVTAIAANGYSSYFLKADGSLWGMGTNAGGQLGDGSTVARELPVQAVASHVVAASAGGAHLMFLKADGTLWGFGQNGDGQLGDGSTVNRHGPVQVATGVAAVSAGAFHTMFIKADRTLWATGGNSAGQLGTGGTAARSVPVQVATEVASVGAGDFHTMFVKPDGSLWGMGQNASGALCDGTVSQRFAPTLAVATGVAAVNARTDYTLFVKTDGTLWGGGSNLGGQLGNGTPAFSQNPPVQISTRALAPTAALNHSRFLRSDGTLWVMGDNTHGQLGDGTTTGRPTAVQVSAGAIPAPGAPTGLVASDGVANPGVRLSWSPVVGVTRYEVWRGTSENPATATRLTADAPYPLFYDTTAAPGTVYFYWVKSAAFAQVSGFSSSDLGGISVTILPPPVITAISPPRQIVNLGQNLTLNVTVQPGPSTSYQWKRNGFSLTGATAASYAITAAVPASDSGWYQVVVSNPAGSTTSAVVFVNVAVNPSQVAGWGDGGFGQTALKTALGGVSAVATGGSHSIALKADGTVVGWGSNSFGETSTPGGLSGAVAVAAGYYFNVALKSDGTVAAWGNNGDGQATVPAGLSGVVAISAGYFHALALKADGTIVAWGWSALGLTTIPSGLTGVVAVCAGPYHSIALKVDGTVVGWGHNTYGQATPPTDLFGVVGVAAGAYHTLARRFDGTVVGWGAPYSGQLPVPVGLNGVVALAAGFTHSLALKSDGTVVAWGDNYLSQSSVPTGLSNVVGLAAGGSSTLVLRTPAADTALPSITTSPATQTAYLTGTVNLTVTLAANSAPPVYQWRKGGNPIAGAMNSTYTITNIQAGHAGSYDVVVTNGIGSVTSAAATLTVATPPLPVITAQPASGILNVGNSGSFRVTAGSPAGVTMTYQWRKGGVPIPGKNDVQYVIGPVAVTDAGSYDVVVTNPGGSLTSQPATLTINPTGLPVFTGQPMGGIINVGDLAWFSATATGAVPMTFQWRKDTAPISGATDATLSILNAQLGAAGVYDVVATNGFGSTVSAGATVLFTSMLTAPTITQAPLSQVALAGVTATFSVTAGGVPAPTFQWRRNGTPLVGATAATLNLGLVQEGDAGTYDVVASNLQGSVISGQATLTVRGRPVIWTARLALTAGDAVGTFVLEGAAPKRLLVRAVGPTLTTFGVNVADALVNPKLEIFDNAGQLVVSNDDWSTHVDQSGLNAATAASGAFALTAGSKDAVVLRSFAPGTYFARVTAATPGGRLVLVELYDAESASATRVPYTAARGWSAQSGGDIVIGGLGASGTSQRTYLLRASGPALGAEGTLANPTFTVLRDSVVRASNDDWQTGTDTTGVAAAAARVGAFSFAEGSRDAALLVTASVRAGQYVGHIAGAGGSAGLVLVEAIEADESRPAVFAPAVVSPPGSRVSPVGANVTFEARATGTAPVAYQWRKDGVTLPGATARSLLLPNVVPANAGVYTVVATNPHGTATSLPAALTVDSSVMAARATQAVASPSAFTPGGLVTITNTLTYTGAVVGFGWSVTLPPGWSYAGGSGIEGDIKPAIGATGTLEWSWTTPPASPVTFNYTLVVPAGETVIRGLSATVLVRSVGVVQTVTATPNPLLLVPVTLVHSADTNPNFSLSVLELTRVIELYNTRNGTVRTGAYAVAETATEDGFVADPARALTAPVSLSRYHSADSNQDGKLSIAELTRVIELYNVRAGTTRTGAYHIQAGTEDGFAPGLAGAVPAGFVLIPGGTFTMGSVVTSNTADPSDGLTDAWPHAVTLSPFYLAVTGTKFADWVAVRDWAVAHGYSDLASVGAGKADTHPVQQVLWYDVVKWCNAKSEKENLVPVYYSNDAQTTVYRTGSVDVTLAQVKWTASGYRLPTEAEWEYAARGGLAGKRFPWGDTITHAQANYFSDASFSYDVSNTRGGHPIYQTGAFPYTSPVGSFPANGYGLTDMAGNVLAWTWDWYGSYSSTAETDPRGPTSGSYRVLRGGSWVGNTYFVRSAARSNAAPDFRNFIVGFRPARSSVP